MDEQSIPKPTLTLTRRHGCLTAWLILLIISTPYNIASYLMNYRSQNGTLKNFLNDQPAWYLVYFIVFELTYLFGVILLFRWKKAGFWIICAASVIGMLVNYFILHYPLSAALMGFAGIFILYGVLQLGKENKGWRQLK